MRVCLAFLAIALTACSFHVDKTGREGLGTIPSYTKGELAYALVKEYIFNPKCVSCHGNSGGINLENYSSVKQNILAVESAALKQRTMPKAPFTILSAEEAQLLQDWIDIGAPEFPGEVVAPPPPLEPKFSSIHDSIFAPKCLSCHNPQGKASNVPLNEVGDLVGGFEPLVVPGDPNNSYLLILVSPGARRPMPPLSTGVTLSDEEINIIKEWIINGARD